MAGSLFCGITTKAVSVVLVRMRTKNRTARIGIACLTAVLLNAQAIIALAQSTDIARCAEIETDAARLACFDALARELGQANVAERAAPEPTDNLTDNATPRTENEDAFGAELIGSRETLGPDEIQSRLVGEFAGWHGNTTFTLENGQIWRQAEEGRLVFRSDAPLITIRRGAFGTYRLTVEGVNRSVRVRRLE